MQNNVNIGTKESDLEIKYDSAVTRTEREAARTSLKYILTDMNDIRKQYIRLGFHLDEFVRNDFYYDFGYLTMEEFCDANLGLSKSSVSRCINVYRAFNASNSVSYSNGVKKKGCAMEIADEYKNYSYSQLCEMVSMDEEQRKQVSPDMTIKQIREMKKGNVSRNVSPVATSQPTFNYKEYENAPVMTRKRLIKECSSKKDVTIDVFDKNGKFLYGNIWCELICTSESHYMFRLYQEDKTSDSKKEKGENM